MLNLGYNYFSMDGRQAEPGLGSEMDFGDLNWEASYAIALALKKRHPEIEIEAVSLGMIYRWTIELPGFDDDPELANDEILSAIYQEWFEEVHA